MEKEISLSPKTAFQKKNENISKSYSTTFFVFSSSKTFYVKTEWAEATKNSKNALKN